MQIGSIFYFISPCKIWPSFSFLQIGSNFSFISPCKIWLSFSFLQIGSNFSFISPCKIWPSFSFLQIGSNFYLILSCKIWPSFTYSQIGSNFPFISPCKIWPSFTFSHIRSIITIRKITGGLSIALNHPVLHIVYISSILLNYFFITFLNCFQYFFDINVCTLVRQIKQLISLKHSDLMKLS